MSVSQALLIGTIFFGALLCAVVFYLTRKAVRPNIALRLALIPLGLGFFGCLLGMPFHESTRPLTAQEVAQAKWNDVEWYEPVPGSGVYRMPEERVRKTHYQRVIEREAFYQILARFVATHPELEVVSTTSSTSANGGTMYHTVVTRPRAK